MLRSDERVVATEPIVMELLAGTRSRAQEIRVRSLLAACELESVRETDWEDAAAIYSGAQRRGVTLGEQIDCLIAAVAIRASIPVLTADRDFELIAEHAPLLLAR
jgi:predicted nucleic acid-binding protein